MRVNKQKQKKVHTKVMVTTLNFALTYVFLKFQFFREPLLISYFKILTQTPFLPIPKYMYIMVIHLTLSLSICDK